MGYDGTRYWMENGNGIRRLGWVHEIHAANRVDENKLISGADDALWI